jgi:hypothetical protein
VDNLPRVWAEGYLQRCLPEEFTSAPNENPELRAVDAPAASLNNGEIHAVFHTAVSAQNAPPPGDVVGSSQMPFWKWSISH